MVEPPGIEPGIAGCKPTVIPVSPRSHLAEGKGIEPSDPKVNRLAGGPGQPISGYLPLIGLAFIGIPIIIAIGMEEREEREERSAEGRRIELL